MASITLKTKPPKSAFVKCEDAHKSGPGPNQHKLSNKISFYYPFIKFIEDIDLTTK